MHSKISNQFFLLIEKAEVGYCKRKESSRDTFDKYLAFPILQGIIYRIALNRRNVYFSNM